VKPASNSTGADIFNYLERKVPKMSCFK